MSTNDMLKALKEYVNKAVGDAYETQATNKDQSISSINHGRILAYEEIERLLNSVQSFVTSGDPTQNRVPKK